MNISRITSVKKSAFDFLTLHVILAWTFSALAIFVVLAFIGQKLNLDLVYFQTFMPFSDRVIDIPLLSIAALHIESASGPIEKARFVVVATLFFYVAVSSSLLIAVASWLKKGLLNSDSVSLQLFYWFAFIFLCCLTLFFYPEQIWGRNSLAYRWAVQSDFRYLLLAAMVGGTNLFVASVATFLCLKRSKK